MVTIKYIVSMLVGLMIGLTAAFGFKRTLRHWKIILRVILSICTIIAIALLVAKVVELAPDDSGSFGDWLGYWGDILGSIIGAIVAAAISYFVTTATFTRLNHKKAVDEQKFKVQVQSRPELLRKVRSVKLPIKKLNDGVSRLHKLSDQYKENTNHNDQEQVEFIGQVTSVFSDMFSSSRSDVERLIEGIRSSDDFATIAEIRHENEQFEVLLLKLNLDVLSVGGFIPYELVSEEENENSPQTRKRFINEFIMSHIETLPKNNEISNDYMKIIEVLRDFSQYY